MARLDFHPMPGGGAGYVLDVQAELLDHLATRVVVPLLPAQSAPAPISELNPVFEIGGERHVMLTQALAAIPLRELKRPAGSLAERHDAVTRALDTLLIGF
ncbi:CcdB family protein [Pseudoroseomonas globiformis]|uniref:Toxin CcdB n=1 Tax=Teichococcus globiformis TaxID=2307229 RepID=A0ABV7G788_9PROT